MEQTICNKHCKATPDAAWMSSPLLISHLRRSLFISCQTKSLRRNWEALYSNWTHFFEEERMTFCFSSLQPNSCEEIPKKNSVCVSNTNYNKCRSKLIFLIQLLFRIFSRTHHFFKHERTKIIHFMIQIFRIFLRTLIYYTAQQRDHAENL